MGINLALLSLGNVVRIRPAISNVRTEDRDACHPREASRQFVSELLLIIAVPVWRWLFFRGLSPSGARIPLGSGEDTEPA
jgi:hypothetical protein